MRVRAAGRSRPSLSQLRQRGRGLERSANIPPPPPGARPRLRSREMSNDVRRARERVLPPMLYTHKPHASSVAAALDGRGGRPSAYLSTESPLEKAEKTGDKKNLWQSRKNHIHHIHRECGTCESSPPCLFPKHQGARTTICNLFLENPSSEVYGSIQDVAGRAD
ncbi:hypothetical protein J0S82_011433 [Galemys pyrenaicus]|uniref:Uncharacterized protein n=1 Tax=Galemys pyrenaicus TaxID=202257 RepID=A0A8J6DRS1_GALPY|nr:hypothetical protein J0S82_011433 [Galemys pyrenaicus]